MSNGSHVRLFGSLLSDIAKGAVKVQTAWATVKSVDWEVRRMVVVGVADDLEYYDVSLGLGNICKRPEIGSLCLIGMINNHDAASFLIDAENVEEIQTVCGETNFFIKGNGVMIESNSENLRNVLNDLYNELGKLTDEISKIVVSIGTGPNVAQLSLIKQAITVSLKSRLNKILIE
jgi:hypothetical protein